MVRHQISHGDKLLVLAANEPRGARLIGRCKVFAPQPCIRWDPGDPDHDAAIRIGGEAPRSGPNLTGGAEAMSCGIVGGEPVLDLDYAEDSGADADANFVLTDSGGLVEVQATAERAAFTEAQFLALLGLARKGVGELFRFQREATDA